MMTTVTKIFYGTFLVFILLQSEMLCASSSRGSVYENRIAAYVEDRVITTQQVEVEVGRWTSGNGTDADARKKVLEALSEKIIITKEFERMQGKLPENFVQNRYDEILKSRFNSDRLKFEEALREWGKTKRSFKDKIREDAIIEFMYGRNVTSPSMVSPGAIRSYFYAHAPEIKSEKRVSLDQAVIKAGNPQLVETVKNCIKNESNYEKLIQQLSEIPHVLMNRNDDLLFKDVLLSVAQKVETLPPNSFDSEGLEIEGSIVFLGLRKVEEPRVLTLVEASSNIERILLDEKYQQLRKKWLDDLKKKAYYVVL
jgi:hypothetical protein